MQNMCFLSPDAILERGALLSECSLDLRKSGARGGHVRRGAVQVRKGHLRFGDPANGRDPARRFVCAERSHGHDTGRGELQGEGEALAARRVVESWTEADPVRMLCGVGVNVRVVSGTEETRTVKKVEDHNTESAHHLEAVGYAPAVVLGCTVRDVGERWRRYR
jgi:hypothetical protein